MSSQPWRYFLASPARTAQCKGGPTGCFNILPSLITNPPLREADVAHDAVMSLGGWAGNGGVSETYGGGLKASTLAREIAKVKYPGLDLRHLQAK